MKYNKDRISTTVLLLIFLLLGVPSFCQSDEYLMKAGFIERFTRFISWPNDSVQADSINPFIITVLGKNPFDGTLNEFYSDTRIKKRNVVINYISSINELGPCHILFISGTQKRDLEQILNIANQHAILTISETKGFAKKGVLINFYIEQNKIRFEINQQAFKESGLKVSHLLLKIAKVV